ncbi:IPTL-CTERM sorting domain-containing protein [Brevundimonas sp. TWP2-3-4b1]|uniref:IPTL-CTERM sorting domain-containing protein n=1 Tax=Brevundimonas sp. TWP2-3-4b1 TaxID=2804580 RepID=UPI003CFAA403
MFKLLRWATLAVAFSVLFGLSAPASAQTVTVYGSNSTGHAGGVFDASGNYFVSRNGFLQRVTGNGTVFTDLLTLANYSTGMAVRGGNLYYSDENANAIYRIATNCVAPCTPTLVANTPTNNPEQIAFDAAGNLFYSNFQSFDVYRLAAGCVEPCTSIVHANGGGFQFRTFGVAIAANGDRYFSTSAGRIVRTPAGCAEPCTGTLVTTVPGNQGGSLTFTNGVLYMNANTSIYAVPTTGAAATVYAASPSFVFPYGLATAPNGDLVLADLASANIFRIAPVIVPVPTLSEWAMILLGLMLAAGAILIVQRRTTVL